MKLSEINKKPFFKVPINYFEKFDDRLGEITDLKRNSLVYLQGKKKYAFALTMLTLTFAFAVISFFYFKPKTTIENSSLNTLNQSFDNTQVINYLANSDISLDDIIYYMQENNIDPINSQILDKKTNLSKWQ